MKAAIPASGPARVEPEFWSGRRVLLTGNTGFKGAWLSLWLQRLGADVTGFSRGAPTDPSLFAAAGLGREMRNIVGDIRDPEAVGRAVAQGRPEVVIHMAAQPLVRRSFEDPRGTFETNVMGTVNLLDAVRRSPDVGVLVNVTTDKCYENREWDWAYREDEPLGGHDPYASSKACSELVTSSFRRSFFSGGGDARIATARAGNVIGGGDWAADRLVPDAIRAGLAGQDVRLRNPNSIRPWQHVLNPLSGYLILAQALWDGPEHAGAWNFGPPEEDAQPARWIVERLAERWPGGLGWVADDGPHPHEAGYLKLDSSRARGRLGWRPPVSLAEALASVAEWHVAVNEGAPTKTITLAQIDSMVDADRPGGGGPPPC